MTSNYEIRKLHYHKLPCPLDTVTKCAGLKILTLEIDSRNYRSIYFIIRICLKHFGIRNVNFLRVALFLYMSFHDQVFSERHCYCIDNLKNGNFAECYAPLISINVTKSNAPCPHFNAHICVNVCTMPKTLPNLTSVNMPINIFALATQFTAALLRLDRIVWT